MELLLPIAFALIVMIFGMIVSIGRQKVDHGFEMNYYQLTYRRKLKRTIWMMPFLLISLLMINLLGDGIIIWKGSFTVICLLASIGQACYNYYMWQKHEVDAHKST